MKRGLLIFLAMLCLAAQAWAQDRKVSGKVKDETSGTPLPGVTVKIKGTSVGAATDIQGNYSLTVPEHAVLVFSFVGYLTQEKNAGGLSVVDVSLATNSQSLGEVVVAAYGTQTKTATTGAIAAVKGKEVENVPFTSVDKTLQGKVAGLQSTAASGQPGSTQNIRIRGIGSFNASAGPLFVIDGVPVNTGDLSRITTTSNALAGLNPNDIENISVLKDAASSSIYGSRAGNGVILITTKSGGAGKTRIRVDAEYGGSKPVLRDENRPLNNEEYRDLTAEGLFNTGGFPSLDAAKAVVDGAFLTDQGNNTDWLKVVTRTGKQMQYNLSADGGNEKTTFHIGGGYFKQEGTVLASDYNRKNASINLVHNVNTRLRVGANIQLSESELSAPTNSGTFANPVLAAYFLLPSYTPYKPDGSLNYNDDNYPYFVGNGIFNPVALASLGKHTLTTLKSVSSAFAEYKILPDLKISTKYGIDYNNLEELNYDSPLYGDGASDNGRAYHYYTRYFNWVWTNLAEYHKDFKNNGDYVLNVKAGYEAQKNQQFQINAQVNNMPSKAGIIYSAAGATPVDGAASASDYAFAALLGLGDFSYKSRYVLSGSFRRDGSSRFGSEHRYGNFYSVGASWNMDQEEFIKKINWITTMKLRVSYGVNGNANFPGTRYDYAWRKLYGYGSGTNPDGNAYNYVYNGGVGSAPLSPGNYALTWEQNKPFDVGVDAGFFQGRLTATLEYYNRKTSNLLLNEPLSATSGFIDYLANIGAMTNKGFEVALTGTPVIAGDFRWDVSFNIAHNVNRITALTNGQQQVDGSFVRAVGKDYQTFYLREWAGVDPDNGDPLWYKDATHKEKTNSYTTAVRNYTGSASPKYFGGLGTTLSWKGISVEANLYYNYGNKVQDTWARYLQGDGFAGAFNKNRQQLNRWTHAGQITNVPRNIFNGNMSSSEASTRFLYDGGYLRMRDITVGYSLPPAMLKKIGFTSLHIYGRGTNLFTILRDKNLPTDPETGIASQTDLEVFIPKTYTVGINIGL